MKRSGEYKRAMDYRIRHVTTYDYSTPASTAWLSLHLAIREGREQRVVAQSIRIDPMPRLTEDLKDFFGNGFSTASIEVPHVRLVVESSATCSVRRRAIAQDASSPLWERVRDAIMHSASQRPESPAHFLYASRLVAPDALLAEYASRSFPPGRGILAGARDLCARIHADFAYSPMMTDVSTPVAEAFARRVGVCQDFSHIMIAGLRSLSLACAYVSGYLRTIPPPGQPRLIGADATHAWVKVWCGDELGWVGLDPTNAMDAGDDHIETALGRDFADVSPISGVFVGAGYQRLGVSVDVEPLEPGALASEDALRAFAEA